MCTLEKSGDIFYLTLTGDDEHRLNPTLIATLRSSLSQIKSQAVNGSVLITKANGKFFSNGFDLKYAWKLDHFTSHSIGFIRGNQPQRRNPHDVSLLMPKGRHKQTNKHTHTHTHTRRSLEIMSLATQRSKRNTRAPTRFEDEPDHPTPSPVTTNDGTKKQKRRRLKNARDMAMRELGRWKPADDLALILAVQQRNDLVEVWRAVKFSCKFSFQEVEDRWYALLYCAPIQRVAMAAMRQLPPDVVAQIHAKTLFSKEEEELLKTITIPPGRMTYVPPLEIFKQLLDSNSHIFLPYRTEKHLRTHWLAMRYFNLIPVVINGRTITPRREEMPSFSEVEEIVDKNILNTLGEHIATNFDGQTVASKLKDDPIHQELMINSRRIKREIRKLENELPKWQALVDKIRGTSESDFSDSTSNIAVLRGRHMRYLMQLNQITFGRCTKDSIVDVDLSLEGPANRISRRQGMIELQTNGEFVIINTGRRPFYVDSQPVLEGGNCTVIHNNSVVEIDGLRFVFLVNLDLIAKLKQAASEPQVKN